MSENEGIRVTVEMTDGFEPGERTSAALAALVDALEHEHGDGEVSGFGTPELPRTFSFVSPQASALFEAWPSKVKTVHRGFDGKGNDQ